MITLLRILLLPFSLIYCFIIFVRNFLFDKNIFKSVKISKPVISVGNISTGGTGKSPFTIFLAEHFLKNGMKPAVISRGYKRESDSIEVVFDGNKITGSIEKCGDEPLMMADKLSSLYKDFFIITGSDRVKTAEFSVANFNPDVIILDDAFQHRKIKRDVDIVLIDMEDFIINRFKNSLTIPSGNLREQLSSLKRADIIIKNNKFGNSDDNSFDKFGKNIFRVNYQISGFFDQDSNKYNLQEKEICAFAGIANPDSFFTKFESSGFNSINKMIFKDHHKYTVDDINKLTANTDKDTVFVTTEKDFVKIKHFGEFLKYFSVLFMKIELNLNEEDRFFGIINKLIKESKK